MSTDAMIGLKAWIKENPNGYGLICGWFHTDVKAGQRPSTKRYAERIRIHPANLHRSDAVYRFNNSWTGPLNRILAGDYPEYAHLLHMRASKYDPPTGRPFDNLPPETAAAFAGGHLF